MTAFKVAIPARYGASRLPGKPLRRLGGRPMIEHVHRRALESGAEEVWVATDDARIEAAVRGFGGRVLLTAGHHQSGTDRLAELAERLGWGDEIVVVNLQGDEPFMPPALVRQVATALDEHPEAGIATVAVPIAEAREAFDPHVVKVVTDHAGFALYFSRAPIPYHREAFASSEPVPPEGAHCLRHVGLYAYRVGVLKRFAALPPAPIETAECLEQLRALWHGVRIHVALARQAPPPGIDTEADLRRAEVAAVLSDATARPGPRGPA